MKVFILTEGGKEIGFGHLTRCIALSQAIKYEKPGVDIKFIFKGDKKASKFLEYQGINGKRFNWIDNNTKIIEKVKGDDHIIIDSYLASFKIYKAFSDKVDRKLIMIDDYNRIKYPPGIVVNPSIYGDRLDYPENASITYLLDKEYIILRREFWEVPDKEIKKEVKNIVITFGGKDFLDLVRKIKKELQTQYDYDSTVINTAKKRYTAHEMLDFMLKADICISGGGQTTYELARIGVPTIGICFAENQKLNLKYGEVTGYLKWAGYKGDKELLYKILRKVEKMCSGAERRKLKECGKNNIDGRGAIRLAKYFLNNENKTGRKKRL
ncbi:MAG: PseG/SpsG family protein [Atribacterota bacterium]